jgi:tetratricopeptide (TPR) repeat protein
LIRNSGALLLLLLLVSPPVRGEPAPPGTPEGTLTFADAVLRAGDSYRAATEYMRFLHHFPDHPAIPAALEGLGRSYSAAGRWDEAIAIFSRLEQTAPTPERQHLLGAALYSGKRYEEAARWLLRPEAGERSEVLGTLAWLRAGSTAPLPAGAREDLHQDYAAIPRKSPSTAGFLSAVLPGSGHLYCDRPRDAAIAFVLNAAFIWGTVEAVRQEEYALAGILGLFELGWYSGTLVSSVNAAHKWNRRAEGSFFRQWEEWAVPRWSVVLGPGSVGGSVAWRW